MRCRTGLALALCIRIINGGLAAGRVGHLQCYTEWEGQSGRYGRGRGIGEFMAASIVCVGPPAKEQWRKMRSATE